MEDNSNKTDVELDSSVIAVRSDLGQWRLEQYYFDLRMTVYN